MQDSDGAAAVARPADDSPADKTLQQQINELMMAREAPQKLPSSQADFMLMPPPMPRRALLEICQTGCKERLLEAIQKSGRQPLSAKRD